MKQNILDLLEDFHIMYDKGHGSFFAGARLKAGEHSILTEVSEANSPEQALKNLNKKIKEAYLFIKAAMANEHRYTPPLKLPNVAAIDMTAWQLPKLSAITIKDLDTNEQRQAQSVAIYNNYFYEDGQLQGPVIEFKPQARYIAYTAKAESCEASTRIHSIKLL